MTCKEFANYTDDYINGTLSENLKREMDLHMAECEKCRDDFLFMQNIVKTLNNMDKITVSDDFLDKLNKRIDSEKSGSVKRFIPDWRMYTGLAAAVIFAVILSNTDLPQIGIKNESIEKGAISQNDTARKSTYENSDITMQAETALNETISPEINSAAIENTAPQIDNIVPSTDIQSDNNAVSMQNNNTVSVTNEKTVSTENQTDSVSINDTSNTEKIKISERIVDKNSLITQNTPVMQEENKSVTDEIPQNENPQADTSVQQDNTPDNTETVSQPTAKEIQNNVPAPLNTENEIAVAKIVTEEIETAVNLESDSYTASNKHSGSSGSSSSGSSSDRSSSSGGSSGSSNRGGGSGSGGSGGSSGYIPMPEANLSGSSSSAASNNNTSQYTLSVSDISAAKDILSKYSKSIQGNRYTVNKSDLASIYSALSDNGVTYSIQKHTDTSGSDCILILK